MSETTKSYDISHLNSEGEPSTVKIPSNIFQNPTLRHPPSLDTLKQASGSEKRISGAKTNLELDFSDLDEACAATRSAAESAVQQTRAAMTVPPPTVQSAQGFTKSKE